MSVYCCSAFSAVQSEQIDSYLHSQVTSIYNYWVTPKIKQALYTVIILSGQYRVTCCRLANRSLCNLVAQCHEGIWEVIYIIRDVIYIYIYIQGSNIYKGRYIYIYIYIYNQGRNIYNEGSNIYIYKIMEVIYIYIKVYKFLFSKGRNGRQGMSVFLSELCYQLE